MARGALTDPIYTPGAIMITDAAIVCGESTRARRHVTPAVHRQAFALYGILPEQPREAFEVDHLIPLELGGPNSIANLWPEAAEPRPGFHEKDRVENYLHAKVCAGQLGLAEAQRRIANNWLRVWKELER